MQNIRENMNHLFYSMSEIITTIFRYWSVSVDYNFANVFLSIDCRPLFSEHIICDLEKAIYTKAYYCRYWKTEQDDKLV